MERAGSRDNTIVWQQTLPSLSEARKAVKFLPQTPLEIATPSKPISERNTSLVGNIFGYINRYILKPLNLFQGSISAMSLTGMVPSEETVEAEARELWSQFTNPTSAYVLTFPNSKGAFKGSEHSGVVIGSTKGKAIDDVSSYASWGYDANNMSMAGEIATPYALQTFIEDYKLHGRPKIVEVTHLNTEEMNKKWEWMKKHHRLYSVIFMNCSKVGFRLVRHGLELEERKQVDSVRPKGYWTPHDLDLWASDLKQKRT